MVGFASAATLVAVAGGFAATGSSGSPPQANPPTTGFDPIIRSGAPIEVEDRSGTPGILTGFDPIIGMNPKAQSQTTITVYLDPGQSSEIVAGETYRVEVALEGNWSPGACVFTAKAAAGAKYGFNATPNEEQNAKATATVLRKVGEEWKKVDVRSTAFQVNEASQP